MNKIPVGVQLYTVREDCAKDFRGTIEKIARMGYEGVELAGEFGGMSAPELNAFVTGLGLQIAGAHSPLEDLKERLDQIMEWNSQAGIRRVVCPYLPREYQDKGKQGYLEAAELLGSVGETLAAKGVSLSYHNHSFEFKKEDDQLLLDLLFASTDERYLKAELDTYWIQHGGETPAAFIRKYTNRIELLHIKDMANDADRSFAEVGSGILDWNRIFVEAEAAGVEWYLVEQDICAGPPLECVEKSLNYLRSRGIAG